MDTERAVVWGLQREDEGVDEDLSPVLGGIGDCKREMLEKIEEMESGKSPELRLTKGERRRVEGARAHAAGARPLRMPARVRHHEVVADREHLAARLRLELHRRHRAGRPLHHRRLHLRSARPAPDARPSASGGKSTRSAVAIDTVSCQSPENRKTFSFRPGLRHPERLRPFDKNDTQHLHQTLYVRLLCKSGTKLTARALRKSAAGCPAPNEDSDDLRRHGQLHQMQIHRLC